MRNVLRVGRRSGHRCLCALGSPRIRHGFRLRQGFHLRLRLRRTGRRTRRRTIPPESAWCSWGATPRPVPSVRLTRAVLLEPDPARITARKAFPSPPTGAAHLRQGFCGQARPGYTKPQGSEPENRARANPGPASGGRRPMGQAVNRYSLPCCRGFAACT